MMILEIKEDSSKPGLHNWGEYAKGVRSSIYFCLAVTYARNTDIDMLKNQLRVSATNNYRIYRMYGIYIFASSDLNIVICVE